jgi:hypothetical protein
LKLRRYKKCEIGLLSLKLLEMVIDEANQHCLLRGFYSFHQVNEPKLEELLLMGKIADHKKIIPDFLSLIIQPVKDFAILNDEELLTVFAI